jgi:hypothetical protein
MQNMTTGGQPMFRLWIATYVDWRPSHWNQTPPQATAVEPVENALYSDDEAALFLEGFNQSMLLEDGPRIWAVAVPVTVRYDGDARPGRPVRGCTFPLARPCTVEPGPESTTPHGGPTAMDVDR